MLDLNMWLRIVFIVVLLTSVLAYSVNRLVPDLEFDWLPALAMSVGAFVFYLAVVFAILWLLPPTIRIWNKGIVRQQGSSHRRLLRPKIRSITIDASDGARPLLRVESSGRPFECGIAAKVSLASLVSFLREQFPEIVIAEKP